MHLAAVTGLLSLVLYALVPSDERRAMRLNVTTIGLVAAQIIWMILSVSNALVIGNSIDLVFNNFIKTALMSLIVAGSVRGMRDVERLTFVYFIGAVIYSTVIISTFNVSSGEQ